MLNADPLSFLTDGDDDQGIEAPIIEQLHALITSNLESLNDSQLEAFVDLGESLGLSRVRALQVVGELVTKHTDCELEIEFELAGDEEDWAFIAPEPAESIQESIPAAEMIEEPVSDAEICGAEVAPEAFPPDSPTEPTIEISEGPVTVGLGRPPMFEILSRAAEQECEEHPDFENSLGMEMFVVPSGSFMLGSDLADAPRNERPCAPATQKGFHLARFPVTNAQYELFDPAHAKKRLPGAGDDHPVVFVSSLQALKFCRWLSQREKVRRYRLPTEAEWEYAARGSNNRIYPWGHEENVSTVANFADACSRVAWRDETLTDGWAETSPVGSYPEGASAFRIEDMAGNVWEWCYDFYDFYRAAPRTNPCGPRTGLNRVLRGGSYTSRFNGLRATTRGMNKPDASANDIGFRIMCEW